MRAAPKGDNQPDMFVPDIQDLPLKDFGELMNAPLLFNGDYRGNTKKVTKLEYTGKKSTVRVEAPECGIATIRDYDIILFAISAIIETVNQKDDDLPLSRYFGTHAYTFLKFSRRGDGKKQYEDLAKALHRLKSTTIYIGHKNNKGEEIGAKGLSWIDEYKFERDPKTGKITHLEFDLAKWIYDAVQSHTSVLTLNKDYFLFTPQARWIYRLIRKSAGNNLHGWRYSMDELYRLSGSQNSKRNWKFHFKKMLKGDKTRPALLDFETTVVKDAKTGKEYLHYIHIEQLEKLLSNFDLSKGIDYENVPVDTSKLNMIKPWLSEENFRLLKEAKEKLFKTKLNC